MTTALYLKKTLSTNIPKVLTIKKRGGSYPEKDYTTKEETGKMTFLYIFKDVNGQELKHYANEREEETLKDYQPTQDVQVILQETMKDINGVSKRISYLVWGSPGSAEMTAKPQLQNNTTTIRREKMAQESKESEDEKWDRINTGKCVFGYMNTFLALGVPIDVAATSACSAYNQQEKMVDKIMASKNVQKDSQA